MKEQIKPDQRLRRLEIRLIPEISRIRRRPLVLWEEEGKGEIKRIDEQCSVPYPCALAAKDRVSVGTMPSGQGCSR
jgi:hypothetical protein